MLRKIVKRSQELTVKPLISWYLRKDRKFEFEGLKIMVRAGIFHPLFFYSSMVLIRHLKRKNLAGKTLLEPGCGSGFISVWAARQGAQVTALDINEMAVVNTQYNARVNNVNVNTLASNLFTGLTTVVYDFIVINPPYYPGRPQTSSQYAWYAGPEFEYFEKLFQQLPSFSHPDSEVIMVLSQDCEIDKIKNIALKHHQQMQPLSVSKSLLENTYLFKIYSLK